MLSSSIKLHWISNPDDANHKTTLKPKTLQRIWLPWENQKDEKSRVFGHPSSSDVISQCWGMSRCLIQQAFGFCNWRRQKRDQKKVKTQKKQQKRRENKEKKTRWRVNRQLVGRPDQSRGRHWRKRKGTTHSEETEGKSDAFAYYSRSWADKCIEVVQAAQGHTCMTG